VDLLTGVLMLLGVGFLAANLKLAYDYVRFLRRRQGALLTWRTPKPPQYTFALALGGALGLLVVAKLVFLHRQAFGESMMFLYYAYFFPMSLTIGRGFYEDGIWAETTFIPYAEVGGVTWRAPGDAHRHLTIAQSCTPSHSPRRQVRRGAPLAPRQGRRADGDGNGTRAVGQSALSLEPEPQASSASLFNARGVPDTLEHYGSTSDLEGIPEDQPGEHPDQGVPGDRVERLDFLQSAARRMSDAHPAEALVPALQP
jgi:hypothetical protein